jgi:serine/threonine-protein kinase RsbW
MSATVNRVFGRPILDFPSDIRHISSLEGLVQRIFSEHSISEHLFPNVLVALTEAANNAVLHGNQNNPIKKVRICTQIENGVLYFQIKDEGIGFNPDNLPDPTDPENIEKPNGRGVFLMRRLADEVIFEEEGRVVVLGFRY